MTRPNRLLTVLAALALLALAGAAVAKDHVKVKEKVCVVADGDEEMNIRVEVKEEDGERHVKVYEIRDGEEELVREFTGDDAVLELEDGHVLVLDDESGHHWYGDLHGLDEDDVVIGGPNAFFFGRTSGAYLGIHMRDLGEQLAEYFEAEGVLVESVIEDSPAAKAGLKAGDVITRLGDEEISDPADVTAFMAEREPGDEVRVTVKRKGKDKFFDVTLAERDDAGDVQALLDEGRFPGAWKLHRFHRGAPAPEREFRFHRFEDRDDAREELENLKADVEELRALLEELKKDR